MKLNNILLAGAMSAGALSLVGVGAHAAFMGAGAVQATAKTGTVQLTMAQNGAPTCTTDGTNCAVGTGSVSNSNGVSTLTFPTIDNLGSEFDITLPFKVTNTGSLPIPIGNIYYSLVDNGLNNSAANSVLGRYTIFNMKASSASNSGSAEGFLGQGIPNPLAGHPGEEYSNGNTLGVGQSITGTLELQSSDLNDSFSDAGASLPNGAQGGEMQPVLTFTGSDV